MVCPPQQACAGSGLSCSSCSLNAAGRVGESRFHPDPAAPLPTLRPVFYAPFSSPASLPPPLLLPSQPPLHRGERTSLLPGRAPAAPGAAVRPSQWPPSLGLAFLLGLLPLSSSPPSAHTALFFPPSSCPLHPLARPLSSLWGDSRASAFAPGRRPPLRSRAALPLLTP